MGFFSMLAEVYDREVEANKRKAVAARDKTDEEVIIEVIRVGVPGAWQRVASCPNKPFYIDNNFKSCLAERSVERVRAIGRDSGRMYDMR